MRVPEFATNGIVFELEWVAFLRAVLPSFPILAVAAFCKNFTPGTRILQCRLMDFRRSTGWRARTFGRQTFLNKGI